MSDMSKRDIEMVFRRKLSGHRAYEAADEALEKAAEEKLSTACVYMYLVCRKGKWIHSSANISFPGMFQRAFLELLVLMGKRERAEKLFDAMIEENIRTGRLSLVPTGELMERVNGASSRGSKSANISKGLGKLLATHNPFMYEGELEQYYVQDKEIVSRTGSSKFKTDDLLKVKMARAMFAGNRAPYDKVLEFTFFDGLDRIDLNKRIEVPSDVIEQAVEAKEVRPMSDAFGLDDAERKILQCMYNLSLFPSVRDCTDCAWKTDDYDDVIRNRLALLCGLEYKDVCRALCAGGKLISYGILETERMGSFAISRDAMNAIISADLNLFFEDIVQVESNRKTYPIDSFQITGKETDLVRRFLKSPNPVNILLYGPPGTGKTEYAYAIAKECGLQPMVFRNESELSDKNKRGFANCRLRALMPIRQDGSVVIVDEAENVLATNAIGVFGDSSSSVKKGIVNKMLDANRNKVIWILNYQKGINCTTLRRMTYSVSFPALSAKYLKTIAKARLDDELQLDSGLKEKLVELSGQYRVSGATLDNMIKTIKSMEESKGDEDMTDNDIIDDAELVFKANSALLYGRPKLRQSTTEAYDVSVLNTSRSAVEIVEALKTTLESDVGGRSKGIRLLFYGASGTGKTEFARYISEQLGKPIVLKRCSDIFAPYVGMSEMNVRDAFQEAEQEEGILLFDEADSFLSDRASAHRSWERTLVNEFLTQMEEYDGILICTTNLREILDPAMGRRFHFLVEFKPLEQTGVRRLLNTYYPVLDFSDAQLKLLEEFASITPGDFGQLSARSRFYPKDKLTAQRIIDELVSVQNEKKMNHGAADKIGF